MPYIPLVAGEEDFGSFDVEFVSLFLCQLVKCALGCVEAPQKVVGHLIHCSETIHDVINILE